MKFLCTLLYYILRIIPWETSHLYAKGQDSGRPELYMGRWWIIKEGTGASRILRWLTQDQYHSLRLHHIVRPDVDRDLHNHPFKYLSLILRGYYREELRGKTFRTLMAGDTARGFRNTFHRIAYLPEDGVWTLFFMGKNHGLWGFARNGQFIPSHAYRRIKNGRDKQSAHVAQTKRNGAA